MSYSDARKAAFKEELQPMLHISAISGTEEPLLEYLASASAPYCREVYEDGFGNVVCHVGGQGKKLMLCAHADEIGLLVKSISDDGFLYFQKIGGIIDKQMEARQVVVDGHIPGIIGCKPVHMMTEKERATVTPSEDLFIDVGCSSREEVAALGIEIGSYASMRYNYMELANPDLMCCRSLDDRVGCAIFLELMKQLDPADLAYDLYLVYTRQEEVGLRGAQAAANGLEPDYAIAVDTVPCGDVPGVNYKRDLPVQLGHGFVLSITESRTAFASHKLLRQIKSIAKEQELPMQVAALAGMAGTDSTAISVNGKGTRTATTTVPRRYSHSACELMDVNDVLALEDMLLCFVQTPIQE